MPTLPEKGDFVRLVEQNKRFMIIGKVDLTLMNETKLALYSDVYADITGSGGGYVGY